MINASCSITWNVLCNANGLLSLTRFMFGAYFMFHFPFISAPTP